MKINNLHFPNTLSESIKMCLFDIAFINITRGKIYFITTTSDTGL